MALPLFFFLQIKVIGLEHWEADIKLFSPSKGSSLRLLRGCPLLLKELYEAVFWKQHRIYSPWFIQFFKIGNQSLARQGPAKVLRWVFVSWSSYIKTANNPVASRKGVTCSCWAGLMISDGKIWCPNVHECEWCSLIVNHLISIELWGLAFLETSVSYPVT